MRTARATPPGPRDLDLMPADLRAAWDGFARQTSERIDTLTAAIEDATARGMAGDERSATLDWLHDLIGICGTFGLVTAAGHAKELRTMVLAVDEFEGEARAEVGVAAAAALRVELDALRTEILPSPSK